jgi:3-carboxy-cis,cis-muconate cycloisomerase
MAHKRNPVAAIAALSSARQVPGLVATLIGGIHEHERAAGAWQAEWICLRRLFEATGSAAAWLRDALEHLEVDTARMAANVSAAGRARGAHEQGTRDTFIDRALTTHDKRRAR